MPSSQVFIKDFLLDEIIKSLIVAPGVITAQETGS
jgi:hypothetical protein